MLEGETPLGQLPRSVSSPASAHGAARVAVAAAGADVLADVSEAEAKAWLDAAEAAGKSISTGDPSIKCYACGGDHLNVDAGNSGVNGERFSYGSGPVFRLVVALGEDGPEGVNVLPGGQSGLNDSAYFDDQAQLWLANEAMPLHYTVDEVVGAAIGREAFLPE